MFKNGWTRPTAFFEIFQGFYEHPGFIFFIWFVLSLFQEDGHLANGRLKGADGCVGVYKVMWEIQGGSL